MIRYLLILSIFFFSCSEEEAVLENPYQLELSWVGQGYGLGLSLIHISEPTRH